MKTTHGGSRSGSGNKTGSKFNKTRKDKKGGRVGGHKCTPEQEELIRGYCMEQGLSFTDLFINSSLKEIARWKQP